MMRPYFSRHIFYEQPGEIMNSPKLDFWDNIWPEPSPLAGLLFYLLADIQAVRMVGEVRKEISQSLMKEI